MEYQLPISGNLSRPALLLTTKPHDELHSLGNLCFSEVVKYPRERVYV